MTRTAAGMMRSRGAARHVKAFPLASALVVALMLMQEVVHCTPVVLMDAPASGLLDAGSDSADGTKPDSEAEPKVNPDAVQGEMGAGVSDMSGDAAKTSETMNGAVADPGKIAEQGVKVGVTALTLVGESIGDSFGGLGAAIGAGVEKGGVAAMDQMEQTMKMHVLEDGYKAAKVYSGGTNMEGPFESLEQGCDELKDQVYTASDGVKRKVGDLAGGPGKMIKAASDKITGGMKKAEGNAKGEYAKGRAAGEGAANQAEVANAGAPTTVNDPTSEPAPKPTEVVDAGTGKAQEGTDAAGADADSQAGQADADGKADKEKGKAAAQAGGDALEEGTAGGASGGGAPNGGDIWSADGSGL